MKSQFTVYLPIKTVSEANSAEHWTRKKKRHDVQKLCILASFKNKKQDIHLPCTISLTRIAPRKLDSDNLQMSFKWIRDSIANQILPGMAVGRADDDPRIKWEYSQKTGKPKEYAIKIDIYDAPKPLDAGLYPDIFSLIQNV